MAFDERTPLPVSTVVCDRFTIQPHKVSGGSFGLTYKAQDRRTRRIVALKEYYPREGAWRGENGLDLTFADRDSELDLPLFRKEAVALGRSPEHPGLAQFIAADEQNGTGYIALEWIDGTTLSAQSAADDATMTRWFLQLLDAILHLGERHLAHRDVKPENIMIRSDRSAVLVDLGAARLVAGGATFARRTAILSPAFAAPEQFNAAGYQGVWTDIFGLCAAFYMMIGGRPPVRTGPDGFSFLGIEPQLVVRRLEGDALLQDRDIKLLSAIDLGLDSNLARRPRGGPPFLRALGLSPEHLAGLLPPAWIDRTLLGRAEPPLKHDVGSDLSPRRREEKEPRIHAFQTAVIQSLDAARFQESSFLTRAGHALDNSIEQKLALARTEVFLNLMFGREIVLPAGHIADSPAIFAILSEILPIYQDKFQFRIAQACVSDGLPPWRPFRLAIEDPKNLNGYLGFVQAYRYTGAPLPLLQAADRADALELEQMKAKGVDVVRSLFLNGRYDDLEKAVRRDGYGAYAARVARFFSHETSLFPARAELGEDAVSYAEVFRNHLDNDYAAGAGVSEAKGKLPLVEEIMDQLARLEGVEGATGFRGNWYVYAKQFEDIWPLARAYLDAKLFLTLAAKYDINHPVLISQALEYGRFDHSLILGPRFGESMTEKPKLDDGLRRLSGALAGPLPWEELFSLYLDGRFRFSLKAINRAYASRDLRDYRYAIEQHAAVAAMSLPGIVLEPEGRLSIAASDDPAARMTLESYDASLEAGRHAEQLRANAASVLPAYGSPAFNAAGISLLPLQQDLQALAKGEPVLMHYFVKPILLRESAPRS